MTDVMPEPVVDLDVLTGLRPSPTRHAVVTLVDGFRSGGRRCPVGPVMDRASAVVGCVSRPPDRSPP